MTRIKVKVRQKPVYKIKLKPLVVSMDTYSAALLKIYQQVKQELKK